MKNKILILLYVLVSFGAYSQSVSSDTLHWTNYRKLSWNDFKGQPIELNTIAGQVSAVIAANFKKPNLFTPVTTSVVAVFDRKNSWNRTNDRNDTILKYHQVTYDIFEVYCRRLRKEFAATKFGRDPSKIFYEKYNATLAAVVDRNKQFMTDTKMGQNNSELYKWGTMISNELQELDAYRN